MPREIILFGAQLPVLVPLFLGAGFGMLLLDRLFAIVGLYGLVWHPALFRVALFVCLFALMGLAIY